MFRAEKFKLSLVFQLFCFSLVSLNHAALAQVSNTLSGQVYNMTLSAANMIRSGNPAAALPILQQALTYNPASWDINYYTALALEQLGRLDESQLWYRKAYSLDPSKHLALLGVGRILFEQKNYSEALPILEQLASVHPATESSYSSYLSLAQCYAETGKYPEFDQTMQKALAVRSNDPSGWRFAGQEMDHLKQYDLAIKYYTEYLRRFPNSADRKYIAERLNALSFNRERAAELSNFDRGFSLRSDTDDLRDFLLVLDPQHKGISDKSVAQVLLGLSQIPRKYRQQLEAAGYKVVLAPTVLDAMPQLAGQTPRGYADGADWHSTSGAFDRAGKRIVIGEHSHMPTDGSKPAEAQLDETAQHEFGHAYDAFLGMKHSELDPGDANPDYSHSKQFSDQYELDAKAVPDSLRTKLAYYLQPGEAGKEELFAQMFVLFFGHQPEPGSPRESFQAAFPHVLALLEAARKKDPDYEKLSAIYDERLRENTLTPKERVLEMIK